VTLGDQAGPTITPIESLGSTVLGTDATGKLYAGVQAIFYDGQHLTETRFPAFTPLAVEDFGSNGGKEMLFEGSDGRYSLWSMTSSWAYQSNIIIGAGDTSAINTALVKFGLADPAPTLTAIEEAGNTVLNQDQDGNFYANNSAITFLSNSETVQLNAAIYNPLEVIAVDDFGVDGGKQLVFKAGTTAIYVWALDSNWQRDTSSTQIIRFGDASGIEAQEVRFGIDINGGGIGSQLSPVESQGSVILQQSGSGALFAGTDAITYLRNGVVAQLTTSSFGSLQVLAVDDFGGDGGKQLVFKAGTTEIYFGHLIRTGRETHQAPKSFVSVTVRALKLKKYALVSTSMVVESAHNIPLLNHKEPLLFNEMMPVHFLLTLNPLLISKMVSLRN
jgi:hypothetical protein